MNAVVPSTRNERFRMDPRLREDDKQKTKETSKQENVWEGVEYFCLQKAAVRQTRTAFKFVSIIEPHPPSPSFSRTRESIYPRAPSMALGKVLTVVNIYKRRNSVPHRRHSCLQKAATRQTRTVLKFVSIIEPHPPSPSFSQTRESIYPRAPSSALEKVLTATNIPNAERAR
ncbi:hypothetical protein VVNSV5830_03716 [Vibrio vulnificus]|nr:hypothetical protein VVNSV5830_03716 [Vibrio vulnificus]